MHFLIFLTEFIIIFLISDPVSDSFYSFTHIILINLTIIIIKRMSRNTTVTTVCDSRDKSQFNFCRQ